MDEVGSGAQSAGQLLDGTGVTATDVLMLLMLPANTVGTAACRGRRVRPWPRAVCLGKGGSLLWGSYLAKSPECQGLPVYSGLWSPTRDHVSEVYGGQAFGRLYSEGWPAPQATPGARGLRGVICLCPWGRGGHWLPQEVVSPVRN